MNGVNRVMFDLKSVLLLLLQARGLGHTPVGLTRHVSPTCGLMNRH